MRVKLVKLHVNYAKRAKQSLLESHPANIFPMIELRVELCVKLYIKLYIELYAKLCIELRIVILIKIILLYMLSNLIVST